MALRFASVCSGIGAPECAWQPLGWECAFSAEIEPFPSAVYAHHYPAVPNYGDITKFKDWPDHAIDLLVGGTPCQSFSVAGLKKGMDDPRGNWPSSFLALLIATNPSGLCGKMSPACIPLGQMRRCVRRVRNAKILSKKLDDLEGRSGLTPQLISDIAKLRTVDQSNDFDCFLGALEQLGFGIATTILDAQYAGLAQRRQRVFVVGHSGGQSASAAVLSVGQGVLWNYPPSRERGKELPSIAARTRGGGGLGTDAECDGALIAETLMAFSSKDHGS